MTEHNDQAVQVLPKAKLPAAHLIADGEYLRMVARLGLQVAEALQYAHDTGVIHRDIKPGNLLLDERGAVWITDFGLAQLRESEGSVTQTGDLVGTLRYMSPEQAQANRAVLDQRTDVYSLGATLYELLTLEPVFDGTSREGILHQIAQQEPVSLRRRNRAVPVDLETVVLKALEKKPGDRFTTAQALADDLRRWLEDRPIQARRPSLVQRARKWARRHRPLLSSAAAVLLALTAVLGTAVWVAHDRAVRRKAVADGIEAALRDSLDWQQRTQMPEALLAARRAQRLAMGDDVAPRLVRRVQDRLADLELVDRLQRIRLRDGTHMNRGRWDKEEQDTLYKQDLRGAGLDPETLTSDELALRIRSTSVRLELAAAFDEWASVRQVNRRPQGPSWKDLMRVASLADPDPWRTKVRQAIIAGDNAALLQLVVSPNAFHCSPMTLGAFALALPDQNGASGVKELFLRAIQRKHPDDFWANENLFLFYANRPQFYGGPGQQKLATEAVCFARVAVGLRPQSPDARLRLGIALYQAGHQDEAESEFCQAIQLEPGYAEGHNALGYYLQSTGRLDGAIAEYREAIRLKAEFPAAHCNLAVAFEDKGRLDDAIAEYREAIRLKKDDALAHDGLGRTLAYKHMINKAIVELKEATRLKSDFFEAHGNLGTALLAGGHVDEALIELQEAIRLKKDDASAHLNLANALYRKGRLGDAITELQDAIRLAKDFGVARDNQSPVLLLGAPQPLSGNAVVQFARGSLALALLDAGRLDEAITECQQAMRLRKDQALAVFDKGRLDAFMAEYQEAIRLKKEDADTHIKLAEVLYWKGRLEDAIAEALEATRLKKDAETHMRLGVMLMAVGHFRQAAEEFRRGHERGSRRPRWLYDRALAMVRLQHRLMDCLDEKARPKDSAEELGFAWLCQQPYVALYATSVGWYRQVFAARPALANDLSAKHRYRAACAAALAGAGKGKDASKITTAERDHLRQQARDWLRADLAAYQHAIAESAHKGDSAIAQQLMHWLEDDDLADVRNAEALVQLHEAERHEWQKLWQDVEVLRQQAAKPATAAWTVPH